MYLHVNWDSLHGYSNCHIYHIEEQLSLAQICRLPLSPDSRCESQAESQVRARSLHVYGEQSVNNFFPVTQY